MAAVRANPPDTAGGAGHGAAKLLTTKKLVKSLATKQSMNVRAMLGTLKARHKLRRAARLRAARESWPPIAGAFHFKDGNGSAGHVLVDRIPRTLPTLKEQLGKRLGREVLDIFEGDSPTERARKVAAERKSLADAAKAAAEARISNDDDLMVTVMTHWDGIKGVEMGQVEHILSAINLILAKATARRRGSARTSGLSASDTTLADATHQLWEFSCRTELHTRLLPSVRSLTLVLRCGDPAAVAAHRSVIGVIARLARVEKFVVTIKESRVVSAMASALRSASKAQAVAVAEACTNAIAQLAGHKGGVNIVMSERGAALLAAVVRVAVDNAAPHLLRFVAAPASCCNNPLTRATPDCRCLCCATCSMLPWRHVLCHCMKQALWPFSIPLLRTHHLPLSLSCSSQLLAAQGF